MRKIGPHLLGDGEHGASEDHQRFAVGRQGRRAAFAGEQPVIKPLLEAAHLLADGGLRNAEVTRGSPEAVLLDDGQEGMELLEIGDVFDRRRHRNLLAGK